LAFSIFWLHQAGRLMGMFYALVSLRKEL